MLPAQRNDHLELMDDRYGKSATVMISQLQMGLAITHWRSSDA
nr:hypothetical protein [Enterobacter asburiae]